MSLYVVRRILLMIPVLFVVTLLVFSLLHLSGDPVATLLGQETNAEVAQQWTKALGLDQPIYVQYLRWAQKVLAGDLGKSYRNGQPVSEAVRQHLVPTLELGLLALVLVFLMGIPFGVISATKPNSKWDLGGTALAVFGISMPNFWLGILLIYVFAVKLRLLPVAGFVDPFERPLTSLKFMILPAFTLGANLTATVMRMTRSSLLEVLGEDYVRTARAKGLQERHVVNRHALRNAMIPVVTVLGLQVKTLIGGTIIIETVFAVPGIGALMASGIFGRDFPIVQGVTLLMAIVVLVTNLVVDLLYAVLDPRIRYH